MATCEQLDDYLCGWLSPAEAAGFADHLAVCAACQSALELQQRIDRNVDVYRDSIAIPENLTTPSRRRDEERQVRVRVEQRNPVSSRNRDSETSNTAVPVRRRFAAVLIAGAVLLGIGTGLYLLGLVDNQPVNVAEPTVNESPDTQPLVSIEQDQSPDDERTAAHAPVAIQPGSGSIAVHIPTDSSTVSVYRVYSVIGRSTVGSDAPDSPVQD